MDVSSEEISGLKAETTSDDDVTILEDEEDSREHKSEEAMSQMDAHDGLMEAETSQGGSSQDSHAADDRGASLYPLGAEAGDQGGWLWNRDSEVPHGSKDLQTSRGGPQQGQPARRRFQCGICGTTFTLLKNAQRHYRCKHLNYFYWCKYCPNGKESRRYTRREFLEDHFLSHHPDIMCEVSEVKGAIPPDQFDIIPVYVEEGDEEEEDGGADVVTTTDLGAQDRSILLGDSPRGAVDSQLPLEQVSQIGLRNVDSMGLRNADSVSRAPFIDLADYRGFVGENRGFGNENRSFVSENRGFVNDSNPPMSSRFSSKRNFPPPASITQSGKQPRLENKTSAREPDLSYSEDVVYSKVDGTSMHGKAPQNETEHFTQAVMGYNSCVSNHSIPSTSGRSGRSNAAPSPSGLFHPSSAITQDCLIIGSAIPQPPRDGKANDHISSVTTSSPSTVELIDSPNQASQQLGVSSTRHGQMQSQAVTEVAIDQQRNMQSLLGRRHVGLSNYGRRVHADQYQVGIDNGNIVNSSSDSHSKPVGTRQRKKHQQQEIVIRDENESTEPTPTNLSCREIFKRYEERISKYSKAINYRYSSDGSRVKTKTVRHVFVFKKSGDSEEQVVADAGMQDKSSPAK